MVGCDLPGKPNPADQPKLPDQVVDFGVLFRQNCVGCHGVNGELGPAPPLNDPLFLAIVPDEELLRVIGSGRAGTSMPAFSREKGGNLTAEQVRILAKGIKPRWRSPEPSKGPLPSYLAPTLDSDRSAAVLERGAKVFARACAACHGDNGEGSEGMAGAIHDPAFLALMSDQALRRIIITGRSDLGMGMPNYADVTGRSDDYEPLSDRDIGDLTALLASWRRKK
jgi:mono/diheme cytochrome c family protein